MDEYIDSSFILRFVIGGILIIAGLLAIPLVLSMVSTDNIYTAKAETAHPQSSVVRVNDAAYDGPNAVADGLNALAASSGRFLDNVGTMFVGGTKAVAETISQGADTFARISVQSGKFVGNAIYNGASLLASGIGSTLSFVAHVPGKVVTGITSLPGARSVIRPSDKMEVPVIDTQLAELYATHPDLAGKQSNKTKQSTGAASWPVHGQLTTDFGVPHWPYQATHTGLDISTGYRSGATPVMPFKPGRVAETVQSGVGLGNHLIIDHGGGVSSVYGHLYSISVKKGQQVDSHTVLGYEGSTGASTGTHLHFEIRVNGQPVNPFGYINGRP